jgi:hypothetical protein
VIIRLDLNVVYADHRLGWARCCGVSASSRHFVTLSLVTCVLGRL